MVDQPEQGPESIERHPPVPAPVAPRRDAWEERSASGGGISANPAATLLARNSVIALNRAGTGADDCAATFQPASSHNLLSHPAGCAGLGAGAGDFVSVDPKLGPLADNGGLTRTVALRRGSPAIGKAQRSSSPKRDQRGRKRDAHPDIGAFER